MNQTYDALLWKVLAKEGLADLSQFHKTPLFDEVPLYSRLADISFLQELPAGEASSVLLQFALKFLKSVISYEEHRQPYLAAITVWDFSEEAPIVPNLFLWSGPLRPLHDKLTLTRVQSAFGKSIKRMVSPLRLHNRFEVYEDLTTTPDMSRAFVGIAIPPYPRFASLSQFCKEVSHSQSQ